jgi:uncharacterized protein (DUF2249 family)
VRKSVLHIPSFQGEYKIALVFSMIEGLKSGEAFRLVCDQDPFELERVLREANLSNLQWISQQVSSARWELLIEKTFPIDAKEVGCCGMCGGHSKSNRGA